MSLPKGRDIFDREAKARAARLMAERGRLQRKGNGHNGHGRTLVLDREKLSRFEPARERVAGHLVDGALPTRRRHVERREILKVEDLAIHFGGVHALDGVNLTARTAEIAGVTRWDMLDALKARGEMQRPTDVRSADEMDDLAERLLQQGVL